MTTKQATTDATTKSRSKYRVRYTPRRFWAYRVEKKRCGVWWTVEVSGFQSRIMDLFSKRVRDDQLNGMIIAEYP